LLGSATRVGETLRLDAHLLDVEHGTVLGAASVDGRLDDILLLEKQLSSRLLVFLQRDSGFRAAAISPAHSGSPFHPPAISPAITPAPRHFTLPPWVIDPLQLQSNGYPDRPFSPDAPRRVPSPKPAETGILSPGTDPFVTSSARSRNAAAALYQGLDAADRGDIDEALIQYESALK